jgi:DNA repair protein RadC
MRILDLPTSERPRERLAALGPAALADRELIAVLLGTGGRPGHGAHELAERLLTRYGSVTALARAHPCDLADFAGIGQAKAMAMAAAFELGRRADLPDPSRTISTTADLVAVVLPLLRGRSRERLVLVACDNTGRVLGCEVVSEGSSQRALVPVREVIVAALRRDAKAIALAHNHPDGDPLPTAADIEATRCVAIAAAAVGLRLLEHVVVTDRAWCGVGVNADDPAAETEAA